MKRGQAEEIFPFLEARLREANWGWTDIDLIAVGVGPGNFTGIRISVAAARGLSLSLGVPALGVSSFEFTRDPEDGLAAHPAEVVSVPALRERAYIQAFRYGKPVGEPTVIDPRTPPPDLARPNLRVVGYRAKEIATALDADFHESETLRVGERIAQVAEWRIGYEGEVPSRPAPLYVRPADASPPSDPPPVILDD